MKFDISGKTFYCYKMPAIESNMYILVEGKSALIIDPNINQNMLKEMQEVAIKGITVLLSHEHFDHISGVNWLRKHFSTEVICSATCAEQLTDPGKNQAKFWEVMIMGKPKEIQEAGRAVKDEEYTCTADRTYEGEVNFCWHGHHVRMKQAPGHSKGGSLIWLDETILFSGDNLVNGTGVICRPPYGNKKEYTAVTRPLLEALPDDCDVLPGHGEPGKLGALRRYLEFFGKMDRANMLNNAGEK